MSNDTLNRNSSDNRKTSDTTPFRLSVFTNSKPLSRNLADDDLTVEDIDCNGLLHFKDLLKEMDHNKIFQPGYFDENTHGSDNKVIEQDPVLDSLDNDLLGFKSSMRELKPNEPALMCFDFDGLSDTPETARAKLCEIDQELITAGYLVVQSALSATKQGSDRVLKADRCSFSIYYMVRDGSDISRYASTFLVRSGIKYPITFGCISDREYLTHNFVKAHAFDIVIKTPDKLGEYLLQEKQHIQLHSGGLLDTKKFTDIEMVETRELRGILVEAIKKLKSSLTGEQGQLLVQLDALNPMS